MSYSMDKRKAKGSALYTRKLIEGLLTDDRFDFYLVHYDKVDDPLYLKTHEIIMPKIRLPYGSRFVSQMLFFWKYRHNQFDIIHWFQPRVYPFYWLAPAKKIIVTMHGAGDISAPKYFVFSRCVFNFVLKYFHKRVDVAIVDSENGKKEVIEYYNFSPTKISVIYIGGGEDFILIKKNEAKKLVAEKYGIRGSYILDVSRFVPHKNVVTLIAAYVFMRKKYPTRQEKLVIVGGAASKRRDEYVAAEKSGFSEDIIFIDFVSAENLNAVYSASDLFVFPSLSEGFGLPVLEAMASGTPVVTSNVTSMPEIGGNAVVTINPLDVSGLAEMINKILSDENLKRRMIESGLKRAPKFTWKKTAEETKNLYVDICKIL